MRPVDVEKLEALTSRVLEGLGYDLVDLEWKHESGHWVLRVYLDWPWQAPPANGNGGNAGDAGVPSGNLAAGGVGLEDCARVSHALSAELDVEDVIPVAFHLEVSSPGVNRPLKREVDFRRFAGQKARVRARHPFHPVGHTGDEPPTRRNFSGTLAGAEQAHLTIDCDGVVYRIPVGEVEKAHLHHEFERGPGAHEKATRAKA